MKTPRRRTVTYNSARRSRTFVPDNDEVFGTPQTHHAAAEPTTPGGPNGEMERAADETLNEPAPTPIQQPKTPTTRTLNLKTPSQKTPAKKASRRKTPKKSRLKIFDSEEEEEPEEEEEEAPLPPKKTPKRTPSTGETPKQAAGIEKTPRKRATKKSPLQIFDGVDEEEEDFSRGAEKDRPAKRGVVKKGEGRAPKRRKKAVVRVPEEMGDGEGADVETNRRVQRREGPNLLDDGGGAGEQAGHEDEPVDDLEAILSDPPAEPFADSSDSDIYIPETHKKRRKKPSTHTTSQPPKCKPTRTNKPTSRPTSHPASSPSELPPKPYLTLRRVLSRPARAPSPSKPRPKRNRFKWLPTLTSSLPPPPPSRRRTATLYDAVAGRVNYEGFIKPSYHNEHGEIAKRSQKVQPADQVLGRRRRFPLGFEGVEGLVRADEAAAETGTGGKVGKGGTEKGGILGGKGKKILPDGEMLGALHQYVADLYKAEGLRDRGSYIFDETALVAVGVLVEERVRSVLGERGHWSLVDREEGWESGEEHEGEEQDDGRGETKGEELGMGDGGDVVVVEASESSEGEESGESDME